MPLEEYPTENSISGEKVKIELKSELYEKVDGDLFNALAIAPRKKDESDKIEVTFTSDGILEETDELIKLSYTETAITEMDGTKTTITFPKNESGTVLVERSGAVSSAFYIKEKVRNISSYKTQFGLLEIATLGKIVSLDLKGSLGLVKLDYVVELHGMTAQRTKMTIKIRRDNNKNTVI